MSKEIKSNTFSKGLMMDLHPISTPNTVLTDNLNGTFITYDGNEHVLQNDMGNYKLKDCQLKPNYIPIGLKEHAGILYIVSYNPLDEHIEIGTYPSPEIKTPSSYNGVQKELWTYDQLEGDFLYSEIENAQSVIWYDEKLKINPGDYYKLTTNAIDSLNILKNAWFIMTDEKTLQEIDIEQNTNDYVPVTWEYPGYLVFQQKIVTPTEFNAFVSQLNLPSYIDNENSELPNVTDGKVGFELTMSKLDYNRITKNKTLNEVIGVNVIVAKIDQNGNKEILNLNWNSGEEVYTVYDFGETEVNIFGLLDLESQISGLKKTDTLTFDIIPVFKDESFSVSFDQYRVSETVSLNKIGTIEDLKIGSEVYKFWRKNNTCYIVFDIESPTIVVGNVDLYYRLVDLNGNAGEWIFYEDEVLSGENMISLHLTPEQKEQIYILEFCFGGENGPDDIAFNKPRFKKLLITSVVFNEFVGTHSVFDKELSFPDWYKLHDKYSTFNPEDLEINFDLNNYTFTSSVEKEIIKTTNERYWNTSLDDVYDFTYSLAIKEGEENPQIDYTFGYEQDNIPVSGNINKLNEGLLNYGIWEIPAKDVAITIGNTTISCNDDGTFSDTTSCLLAKNTVIDTIIHDSSPIPSVDKVYVNRNLDLEQTDEKGNKIILDNQQIVGHQYGAGAANSSEEIRKYNWLAENVVVGNILAATKISTVGKIITGSIIAGVLTGGAVWWAPAMAGLASIAKWVGWAVLSVSLTPLAIWGAIGVVGAILALLYHLGAFYTEKHLSWASSLYATNIDSLEEILEQFDEVAEGQYKENEKFKESLNLSLLCRDQGTQWNSNNSMHTTLEEKAQTLLQQNGSVSLEVDGKSTSTIVQNNSQYSCFPVILQRYNTENNGWVARDGIVLAGEDAYYICPEEFETAYTICIAFLSPKNNNTLIYVPCKFESPIGFTKAGNVSNSVDKSTGAPTNSNGVVVENDTNVSNSVTKMLSSAMIWCRNLFVIPEEGTIINANFMEPMFSEIPDNVSVVFEYACVFDYQKASYLGKSLNDNRRVSLYGLTGKVENLNLLLGASVALEKKSISDKILFDTLDNVSENIIQSVTEGLNVKLNKYRNFSEYCRLQIIYSRLDPVVTENTIRNGKMKGVYNLVEDYDASGGILNTLTQLKNLDSPLTLPITDVTMKFMLSRRNKCDVSKNPIYVVLGYDSKTSIDCSKIYFDLSTQ